MRRKELFLSFTRFTVGHNPDPWPPDSHIVDSSEINVPRGLFPEKTVISRSGYSGFIPGFRLFPVYSCRNYGLLLISTLFPVLSQPRHRAA